MKNLDTLKQMLMTEPSLPNIMHYFFDLMEQKKYEFGEALPIDQMGGHPALMGLKKTIEEIARQELGKTLNMTKPLFFDDQKHQFLHGTFIPKEETFPLAVIYFSDIETGLTAFLNPANHVFFKFHLVESKHIH